MQPFPRGVDPIRRDGRIGPGAAARPCRNIWGTGPPEAATHVDGIDSHETYVVAAIVSKTGRQRQPVSVALMMGE